MSSFIKILIIALIIASLGILSIYSATFQKEGSLWQATFKRQMLWVFLAIVTFIIISRINYRWLWDGTYFLYAANLIFLFLVFLLGVVRSGAQRWLRIAWFNFQPSELVKLIIIIFLSRYFSKKSLHNLALASASLGLLRGLILPFLFVAVPAVLIIEQPDLGTGLILILLFIVSVFLAGVRLRHIFIFASLIIGSLPFFWHNLRGYQKERLLVFLNPNIDPLGAGYTIIQSKIAIGSGGIFGKGWLAGTQSQLRFLPESHTDFIFATFAEQWGFLGSVVLLVFYYLLIRQGIIIAQRNHDYFGRFLALGISTMLGIQVFINIAMNLGLAPVVGLPLPLMSYGGSSVVVTFIALGILVNIDRTRTVF